ncbi:MAG: Holliday junction branch migration protein RuvA [Coriobacteriia bacterium]|nr:Holliday junction branch migration protein RuvA [Coriobacteriia bacterium]
MIAFLRGRVTARSLAGCVIDVGGVGYRLAMSTASLAALPSEGGEATVLTHLHVRADEMSLFGFATAEEKTLFEQLITVSGVGPKVALAALSAMPPAALVEAIVREDAAAVAAVPGIGKKTAQRVVLELKDKLGAPEDLGAGGTRGAALGAAAEAREALLSMGFSPAEVGAALKGGPAGADAAALLRRGLRRLGGAA